MVCNLKTGFTNLNYGRLAHSHKHIATQQDWHEASWYHSIGVLLSDYNTCRNMQPIQGAASATCGDLFNSSGSIGSAGSAGQVGGRGERARETDRKRKKEKYDETDTERERERDIDRVI